MIGHNVFRKIHHCLHSWMISFVQLQGTSCNLVISSREEQHLAIRSQVLVNPDALVLMSLKVEERVPDEQKTNLCGNHHIGLIEDKHCDLTQIKEPELETPIKHLEFNSSH